MFDGGGDLTLPSDDDLPDLLTPANPIIVPILELAGLPDLLPHAPPKYWMKDPIEIGELPRIPIEELNRLSDLLLELAKEGASQEELLLAIWGYLLTMADGDPAAAWMLYYALMRDGIMNARFKAAVQSAFGVSGYDKFKHLVGGMLLALAIDFLTNGIVSGGGVAVLWAFLLELHDEFTLRSKGNGNGFDRDDFFITVRGALLGELLSSGLAWWVYRLDRSSDETDGGDDGSESGADEGSAE